MTKKFWQSKTVWGFGLATIAVFGQQIGWVGEGVLTNIVQYGGTILGIVGAREALK